jgi:class 3 adenylate cyclase
MTEPHKRAMQSDETRRYLTILFSDLVGSTALSQTLEAEDYAALLGSVRKILEQVISLFGGTIIREQGDGVLALFGYPASSERDGMNAVRAALQMHEGVRLIDPRDLGLESDYQAPALLLHTGIHTGLSLLHEGDLTLGRFDLLGSSANLAFSLCQNAGADEVLISAESLSPNLRRFFDYRELSIVVKGSTEPVRVLKPLAWLGGAVSALDRPKGELAIEGRDSEVRAIQTALDEVRISRSKFLLVCGEPGIGKSHLVRTFLKSSALTGTLVYDGVCGEGASVAFPFQPFVAMLGAQHADVLSLRALDNPLQEDPIMAHAEVLRALLIQTDPLWRISDDTLPGSVSLSYLKVAGAIRALVHFLSARWLYCSLTIGIGRMQRRDSCWMI